MGIFRQFPYSNFHEMNMDEIIKIIKNMLEEWARYHAEWDAWMAEINDDWANYQEVMNEAWQNMQDFINNYFDNLDVQEEINNKIVSMVNTGEFASIVEPFIPPKVTEWLSANITQPVGVVIDTSLTVAGACADAKATGEAITDLKSDIRNKTITTWNIWDGSFGIRQANPVTGASVPYQCCSPIIPVVSGENYSVGIVENTLPDKIQVVSIRFYDIDNQAVGNVHTVYTAGGYLDWITAPTGATSAVMFFNTNDVSIPVTALEVLNAKFKVIFANRLVNFTHRDSSGRYAFKPNEWLPTYQWTTESIEHPIITTLTVGESPSDFTSLRDAIDTIENSGYANENNQYIIRLKEGIYNISGYYTDEEKAEQGFIGLTVPDWVTIRGIGSREKTILTYLLENPSTAICVLNFKNTASIENITLYGAKTRYCVHDDKANGIGIPYTRHCKNVHFKGDTMTYGAVYGAGINSNAEWIFEDCIFESLTESSYQNCVSIHSSGQAWQVGMNHVIFDNCRFIGHGSLNNALILSSVMSTSRGYQDYCKLQGCQANGRLILREENASAYGAGILWWATGYATTFTDEIISNTDGLDYSDHINII